MDHPLKESTQSTPMASRKNQRGQSLLEYLILTALMAVTAMGVVRTLGQSISAKFAQITKVIQGDHETNVRFDPINPNDFSKKDMSDFMNGALADDQSSAHSKVAKPVPR
jgi:Flp pilus assembly pilin Flp